MRTLGNAVRQGKVHHAYLFVGSRGTGKTSMAKILAACMNCVEGPTLTPCGVCDSCVSIHGATSLDVIEMDAASNNSVDDIRDLREKVAYAPVSGKHKVYILDEAHMLSQQAWNAFLKTLEEPPPRTIFVLATTEAQKVLPTVVDRCHRFDFGRPTVEQVAKVLGRVAQQEQIDIDGRVLALIARHATGSFRDALGTLEQLVTYAGDGRIQPADVLAVLGVVDSEQLFAAIDAVVARDPAAALRTASSLAESGRDPGQVLRDLEVHARELLIVQVLGQVPPELRLTPERDRQLEEQAQAVSETDAVRLLDLVGAALEATTNGAQPRIQLELVLIKAAAPELDPATIALSARIERLEAALEARRSPAPPREAVPASESGQASAPAPAPEPVPASAPAHAAEAAPASAPAHAAEPAPASAPGHAAEAAPALRPAEDHPSQGGLDLQSTVSMWPAVVDIVRAENAMIAALLAGAQPVAIGERELTVAFPTQAAFLKRKAEQEDHRRVATEAFRTVTGQALKLRYELRDLDELADEPAHAPVLSGEELVKRFLEEFDAEELDDEDHHDRKAER